MMDQNGFRCFALLTVSLILVQTGICLNVENAKEQKCFKVKKNTAVDLNWLASLKTQYYILMSRWDLYRFAHDTLKKDWGDITENEVYKNGCATFSTRDDGTHIGHAFGGIEYKLKVKPLTPGFEKIEFGHGGYSGICDISLTDNSTFIFFACCLDDGQMTWGVTSAQKSLPKGTVSLIHQHAVTLGFKKEYFTELHCDLCETKDSIESTEGNEQCSHL